MDLIPVLPMVVVNDATCLGGCRRSKTLVLGRKISVLKVLNFGLHFRSAWIVFQCGAVMTQRSFAAALRRQHVAEFGLDVREQGLAIDVAIGAAAFVANGIF